MIMEEMTSPEFAAGLKKTQTAILPLGSLEEHGGHLPLITDTLHMAALARAASKQIDVFVVRGTKALMALVEKVNAFEEAQD